MNLFPASRNKGVAPLALLVLLLAATVVGSAVVSLRFPEKATDVYESAAVAGTVYNAPRPSTKNAKATTSATLLKKKKAVPKLMQPAAKSVSPALKKQASSPAQQKKSSGGVASQFSAVAQEIEGARNKGSRFGEEHSRRILRDLAAFETGGYAKAEVERLRKIVQSLSSHITDAAQPEVSLQSGGGSGQKFAAVKEEIEKAKRSGNLFPRQHSDRVLRDLASFEAAGYAKSEIERLRQIVQSLSPHIGDEARAAATAEAEAAKAAAKKACAEAAPPVLTADITDFSKIQSITAPGSPSHEGPKGHSFINTVHARVPLYAPVAAIYDSGSYTKDSPESPAQYLLFFRVREGCGYQFKFDHADELVPALKDELFTTTPKVADSRTAPATKTIEFAAGELIGYTRGTPQAGNWDFGLYNTKEEGKLAAQGSYGMHRYSVCWPDFYSAEKKETYRRLLEGPKLVCSF